MMTIELTLLLLYKCRQILLYIHIEINEPNELIHKQKKKVFYIFYF